MYALSWDFDVVEFGRRARVSGFEFSALPHSSHHLSFCMTLIQ